MATYSQITSTINGIIEAEFPVHPLSFGIDEHNVTAVLGDYLAMSQAFPFLQAGAQKNLILHSMEHNVDVAAQVELTAVVGSFLCWDETGGHAVVRQSGNPGLPSALNTKTNFHSNLLKKDIRRLLGADVLPNYSKKTKTYLSRLLLWLETYDHITRCACMVAFEAHAGIMIDALWGSLVRLYGVDKDELLYFKTHVGGADPAEPYHIEMTERMVSEIVPDTQMACFFDDFRESYALNYEWCAAIK